MENKIESHHFILVLTGINEDTPGLEDALYEAGCDDALINYRYGTIFLEFDRDAESLHAAINSAIMDVEKSKLGAKVARIEPGNLVTISDIAHRTGISRQLIHMYVNGKRGPGNFPMPIDGISNTSPLWQWPDVAEWFLEKMENKISPNEVENAIEIENINRKLLAAATKLKRNTPGSSF